MVVLIKKNFKLLVTMLLVLLISIGKAQLIRGQLFDDEAKPIRYVNIGIVGKNVGTVSDQNGNFTIELRNQFDKDTLKFSTIGLKSLEFNVGDFKKEYLAAKTIQIKLEKSTTILKEITVKPKTFVMKTIGNTANSISIRGGFESNDLGTEVGTVMKMKIKKTPAFIENVNFNIAINEYDTLTFRINIYNMKNGLPYENILPEPVFITALGKTRTLSLDMKQYNLIVEDDFFVSLEWIKELKGKGLYFCGSTSKLGSFSKKTSQSSWQKEDVLGLGFYTTVIYEK